MRHCYSEKVAVFEGVDKDLSKLLREAADVLDSVDDNSWANITASTDDYDGELKYRVDLYVHDADLSILDGD